MFCPQEQVSIESGYLILTMMPSLYCTEKCPHCYLSKEQRADKAKLSLSDLFSICNKIDDYYKNNLFNEKKIVFYWYGGEPTSMGIEYFEKAITIINSIFTTDKGYLVNHVVLTSLVNISNEWFEFFNKYCDGYFQTSFDGNMRGRKYLANWEIKISEAIKSGLKVGTLSVVNEEMLKVGGQKTIEYLSNLGISEAGFLPFMLNEQNKGKKYNRFAPTMENWSRFLIEATKKNRELSKQDKQLIIGQELFFYTQRNRHKSISNIAAQTLFLMPNGDLGLPDYKNGYEEFLKIFGNIISDDFSNILKGEARSHYISKQLTRNFNKECMECEYSKSCFMEFWKTNKQNDDCFGGSQYIKWLSRNPIRELNEYGNSTLC